jgi:hypothetical protein
VNPPSALVSLLPSAICFAAALAAPAVTFWNTNSNKLETLPGWQCAATGFLAIFAGQLSWIANLWFLAGGVLLLTGRWKLAAALGAGSLLVALHAFALKTHPLPANEGGVGELQLRAFGAGYWLWLAAFVLLAAGAAWRGQAAPPA